MSSKRPLNIDELNANHYTVSVHKYGFFLCTEGKARILLGSNTASGIGGKGNGKPTNFVSMANNVIMEEMEKRALSVW